MSDFEIVIEYIEKTCCWCSNSMYKGMLEGVLSHNFEGNIVNVNYCHNCGKKLDEV